ncbi:hypothetical protein LguiA_030233 [Lonicera macranthoides]
MITSSSKLLTLHKYWKMYMDLNNRADQESDRLVAGKGTEAIEVFHLDNCSSLTGSHYLVNFDNLKLLRIQRTSNLVMNFVDSLFLLNTEHAGLPGPIRNKNISSPLFDIPATTEKKRTCSILFDIPPTTNKKDNVKLRVFATYEAKTDGSVSTRISEVCHVELIHRRCKGGFSKDNIHGRKIGFDLVETSGGLANKDYDSKRSSIIWEDINNEGDNEYIHLFHGKDTGGLMIGRTKAAVSRKSGKRYAKPAAAGFYVQGIDGTVALNLLSKLDQLAVDRCWNLKPFPEPSPNIKVVIMDDCISMERLPDLSNSKKSILFNPQRCSFVASHNMLKFNSVKRLRISPQSNLIRNFIDILSQIISRLELKLLAVYEAKKDGLVSTCICGVYPHKQSKEKICFACFESRNCGNYSLVSRIPLGFPRYEIVGGEHIHVYFEIAPSASIVVKMCQLQLFRRTPYTRRFSVDKMKGRKYGFDLAELSCRLANKDEDPKMMIMEDEDQIINNKRDTKADQEGDRLVAGKGTGAIEGISLVLPMTKETKISSTSFARINNLRLLKMNNVHVTGSLEHLSNQLRWLCWHHNPLKCLQSIFHMDKLVVLDMQYSKLNTIWKGSKVDTEHAGLPGPIRNKNISSPLFEIPATTEKRRTCSILFDIPPTTTWKGLEVLVVYEAKTDGSVSTRVTKVLDPHNASCYQRRTICFSHFKSRNCGNFSLVSRMPLDYRSWYEVEGGERIEVCFEIAPSACIVVKMCQVQPFYPRGTVGYAIDKIHGHKIGFDLVDPSSGFAKKDYDSKKSSIWEDEDLLINNKRDTKYIHLLHDKVNGIFEIGRRNTEFNF